MNDAGVDRGLVATLVALVEATPPPPEGEPDALLAAFDAMIAHRAELFARLTPTDTPIGMEAEALRAELGRRDQAWLDALARAQDTVGDRLRAVRRAQRAREAP